MAELDTSFGNVLTGIGRNAQRIPDDYISSVVNRNTYQNLLSNPQALDPQGNLTPQAVQQGARLGPDVYNQLRTMQQQQQQQQVDRAMRQAQAVGQAAQNVLNIYQAQIDKGVPESVARTATQPIYDQAMRTLQPLFTQQEWAKTQQFRNFDPVQLRGVVAATGSHMDQLTQYQQAQIKLREQEIGVARQREEREAAYQKGTLGLREREIQGRETGREETARYHRELADKYSRTEKAKEQTQTAATQRKDQERYDKLVHQEEVAAREGYKAAYGPYGNQQPTVPLDQYINQRVGAKRYQLENKIDMAVERGRAADALAKIEASNLSPEEKQIRINQIYNVYQNRTKEPYNGWQLPIQSSQGTTQPLSTESAGQ